MDRTMHDTNRQLQKIAADRNLSIATIMILTDRSRTLVYGWLCPPGSEHYKPMHKRDLRRLELELGLAHPKAGHIEDTRDTKFREMIDKL